MDETHWPYIENMDAGGLRELMLQYGSEVWNLAFVLTKRRDLADDVSQDVFLAAYRKIDTFRGASSVRTWLLSIARNTAINRLRSAFLRRVTLMERIDDRAHDAGPSEITETTYERSRFSIDGLDYLGWEKKFLPLSSGTFFFDGVLGARGLIQSLMLPDRENAHPDVIKLSGTIIFTTGGEAYTTSDGIKVGLTQAEVIAKLGLPNARTKTQWSYRIGDNLRFHLLFESGKVRFISLTMTV
ncbi:RNA polymerase sigma factor [Cohnella ginsengisoli]|uniref:RNA polymerase sigma factor n=1 Tax=Cohnella ginsengisoli TaxID=425004 RepID=A0A9X4KNQ7_9BACL|nr:RNA polymerase sigma factor [Cohnella ginsengisoli]MDG0795326.1 RNA polymerase sigma factor [Cohnella ginsengisoli]